jgi:siroheme synthase
VSNATGPEQQIRWTNLAKLASEEKLPAPALMIIGRVASQRLQEISNAFWRNEANDRNVPRSAAVS